MTTLITLLHLVLAMFVVGSCICRVNQLQAGKHRYTWVIKYALFAGFAGAEFIDALVNINDFSWFELAGVVAIAVHIYETKAVWRGGPPAVALKGVVRHEKQSKS